MRRGFCSASATALDEPLRPLLPPCCTDPLHAALLCVSWYERNLSSAPGPVHFAPPLPHHACVSAAAITTPGSRTCSSSAECSDAGVESENEEEEEEEEERCLLPVLRAGGAARGRGGGGSEPASAVFRLRLERSRSTSNSTGTAQHDVVHGGQRAQLELSRRGGGVGREHLDRVEHLLVPLLAGLAQRHSSSGSRTARLIRG